MKAAIVNSHIPTAEVLARALASRLNVDVMTFSCIENVLASSMDYDIFAVYNNFGHKITGVRGVALIRDRKPRAFIVGVSYSPNFEHKFLLAGADAFILRAGNEVGELVAIIQKHLKVKPAPESTRQTVNRPIEPSNRQDPAPSPFTLSELLLKDRHDLDLANKQALRKLIARLRSRQGDV
jgi:hypothetical protein